MLSDPRLILDMTCAAGDLWPLVSFFKTATGFTMTAHLVPIEALPALLEANPVAIVFDKSRSCVSALS